MGPSPEVAAVRRAVRASLADLDAGALVLVACSGGADSVALAAALAFEAPRAGLRAGAVTVDHGLQPGSAERAEKVAADLRALGLDPVEVVTVVVDQGGGPEAAARAARYAALDATAVRRDAAAVLLGHTRDDQAETVLLGLARGSGARSLAGMPARRGRYRRPLLALSRDVVRAAAAGLANWEDPHNDDRSLLRARVRHEVMPGLESALGPGVAAALARTADLLRADADALDEWADRDSGRAGVEGGLDVAVLTGLPPAVRTRILRRVAIAAGCAATDLTAGHVGELDRLVTGWHGQGPLQLPGGVEASRGCGRVTISRPTQAASNPEEAERVDEKDLGIDLDTVLITEEQIQTRLAEMAAEIDVDYEGRDVLLVGVLKGAVMVMADLARALHSHVEMDWMAVSSYGSGTKSSGVVRILKDLDRDILDRHVLIVEDIIDSGLTLSWLMSNLSSRGPASVEVCALLRKPEAAEVDVPVRYLGFDIPNEFVIGYGLDYAQRYRNLPFVGTLAPHVYTD